MVVFNWSKLEKFDFEIKNKFKKIRGLLDKMIQNIKISKDFVLL